MQSTTSIIPSLFPCCPKCYYFPTIILTKDFEIEIKCCSTVLIINTTQYLKQLVGEEKNEHFCQLKIDHGNIEATSFCYQCKKFIYSTCKEISCKEHSNSLTASKKFPLIKCVNVLLKKRKHIAMIAIY